MPFPSPKIFITSINVLPPNLKIMHKKRRFTEWYSRKYVEHFRRKVTSQYRP